MPSQVRCDCSVCPACTTCQTQDFWQTPQSKLPSSSAYLVLALTTMSCSFSSSLAINIFALTVHAPNSILTCISQFMLQHSSQFPYTIPTFLFCLLSLTKCLMSSTRTFHSLHTSDFTGEDSTESTLYVKLMLSTLTYLKLVFWTLPLEPLIFFMHKKFTSAIRENPKSRGFCLIEYWFASLSLVTLILVNDSTFWKILSFSPTQA